MPAHFQVSATFFLFLEHYSATQVVDLPVYAFVALKPKVVFGWCWLVLVGIG
jgi:hypothetical protein